MSAPFKLAALPWDEDALAPTISANTISFHYHKHHQTYVDTLNKLVEGTPYAQMKLEQIVQKAPPREIYDLPNSKFVADFVGTTNFIDGTVLSSDERDGYLRVDSAIGLIAVANAAGCGVGDKVTVSMRPENLVVHETRPAGVGHNVFEGTVYSKVFLGETLDLQIKVGEQILLA